MRSLFIFTTGDVQNKVSLEISYLGPVSLNDSSKQNDSIDNFIRTAEYNNCSN